MRHAPLWLLLAFVLTLAAGCKDEPTPHAVEGKSDPRIKRVEMNAPETAAEK